VCEKNRRIILYPFVQNTRLRVVSSTMRYDAIREEGYAYSLYLSLSIRDNLFHLSLSPAPAISIAVELAVPRRENNDAKFFTSTIFSPY